MELHVMTEINARDQTVAEMVNAKASVSHATQFVPTVTVGIAVYTLAMVSHPIHALAKLKVCHGITE